MEHVQKRAGAHYPLGTYLPAARFLFRSMLTKGFDSRWPIPINIDMELLGGAHRTACAHVLGLTPAYEKIDTSHVWPAWGREWFIEHGMADELPWISRELAGLNGCAPRAVHA